MAWFMGNTSKALLLVAVSIKLMNLIHLAYEKYVEVNENNL